MAGAAAAVLTTGLVMPTQAPVHAEASERALTIYNIHTKETVTAVFKRNGRYVDAGLKQLNHIMRDYRRNEATRMDPALFDLLWQVHGELGSKAPIHLVSGFRSGATNEMLRKTVGGQASKSRHILGKAADVHFPDVPLKQLRYSALVQERGGVGYYPTSALPFVHLDTDRVRAWPRLPRHELALLFPSGSTQHMPADGGPITRDDVRTAKARHGELARQIAMFLGRRSTGGAPVAVADAGSTVGKPTEPQRVAHVSRDIRPAPPALVEQPQAVGRPAGPAVIRAAFTPGPADRARLAELMTQVASLPKLISGPTPAPRSDTARLPSLTGTALPAPPLPARQASAGHQLASLGPTALPDLPTTDSRRFDWGGWISAPAYDEEHPEELSYRPFPITPYLTETETQPLLSDFVAHDAARAAELLDEIAATATLHLRPVAHAAPTLLASDRFTGTAIRLDGLRPPAPLPPSGDWPEASVAMRQP
jgi:uncharacterized protein YcbK (DUF882 family)